MPLEKNTTPHYYKLSKPFTYEGQSYEDFVFDFENLTGNDLLKIEHEMLENGDYAMSPEVSRSFQIRIAAKAAKISSDVMVKLPLRDFYKITTITRNFLIDTGF